MWVSSFPPSVFAPRGSGLLTHARHTFNVVDAVSGQGKKIGDLFRPYIEVFGDLLVLDAAFAGEIPKHVVFGDQLRQIFVASDDRRWLALFASLGYERADQIIGLVSRAAAFHQAERSRIPPALHKLPLQFRRRRFAICFVFGIDLCAKG